jgi:hypothetical protein
MLHTNGGSVAVTSPPLDGTVPCMDKTVPWPDQEPILSVPRAGRILGRHRAASYAMAHRGELPVIVVGSRFVVPTARLRELLGLPIERTEPVEHVEPAASDG